MRVFGINKYPNNPHNVQPTQCKATTNLPNAAARTCSDNPPPTYLTPFVKQFYGSAHQITKSLHIRHKKRGKVLSFLCLGTAFREGPENMIMSQHFCLQILYFLQSPGSFVDDCTVQGIYYKLWVIDIK